MHNYLRLYIHDNMYCIYIFTMCIAEAVQFVGREFTLKKLEEFYENTPSKKLEKVIITFYGLYERKLQLSIYETHEV